MVAMKRWLWVMTWFVYVAWLQAFPSVSVAQINTDGSLGTTVELGGPHYVIPEAIGRSAGTNLFHSFEAFNVPEGGSATFQGQPTIENIVGRVTGGDPSVINGTLQSDIPGANLFLLNPYGIVMGKNASLNVQGSFYMSTADALYFEDGVVFQARYETGGMFSMAAPQAFGFVAGPVGDIAIQDSRLTVPNGATLGMIGGDIAIAGGRLQAPSGTLSLASVTDVAAAVRVPLSTAGLVVSEGVQLGHVTITGGAALEADGDGGGLVAIRSGQLTMAQSTISVDNDGNLDRDGASIDIAVTDTFDLHDGGVLSVTSRAAGRGGDVTVSAAVLDMAGGSAISTQSQGSSTGGRVGIRADRIQLADEAFIRTEARNSGRGGHVSLMADEVNLSTNAQIVSNTLRSDRGGAGNIMITAHDVLRIMDRDGDQTGIFAQGGTASEIGEIQIHGGALTMDGGVIGTPASRETDQRARAGNISVTMASLRLEGGARIDSSTSGGAGGGDIVIGATEVVVTGENSSIRSRASGGGDGGSISLRAEVVRLDEGAMIAADSSELGKAGTVSIQAQELLLHQQSTVTTEATQASGGAITIAAHRLELRHSQVTAAVQGEVGTLGGDIDIVATGSVILDHSTISASANKGQGGNINIAATDSVILKHGTISARAGRGQGGRIDIETGAFLKDGPSNITATAGPAGIDGVVGIRAVTTDVSGAVTPLTQHFASTSPLSDLRCAQRLRGGQISSFVVAGRAGLPIDPSGGLPSFLVELPHETDLVPAGSPLDRPIATPAATGWYPCPQDRPHVAQRR